MIIGYDSSGMEGKLVRAFALDITVGRGAVIVPGSIRHLSADYYIYPGSIVIDEKTGEVTDYGSPVASKADYPDGTLGGPGTSGMTIEMASLYAASDPVHNTPPPDAGDLLSFEISRYGNVYIAENVRRGGVVMEDLSPADPVFYCHWCCPCLGDIAEPFDQVDLQDLDAMVTILVNVGAPFIVPAKPSHCGDMVEPHDQVDLQDLDAMVTMLVNAGPPFIVPCE